MKTPSLITALSILSSSFSFAGGEGWTHDFEAAKAQAKKEGKDLLIDFTGSDWCGWCIKLNEEVFQHDPFKKGVADKFVLVELDYPQDKSKMDEKTIEQNEKLQKEYEPRGFPTILLADASGKPYAQTGYQKGGPEAYVKHLDELRKKKTEIEESLAAANALEGVDKAKALVAVLEKIEPQHHKHYKEEKEAIIALDPSDTTGFKKAQDYRAAREALDQQIQSSMQAKKTEDALKAVDSFIDKYKPEKGDTQEILAIKVNLFMATEKLDEAEAVLDKIIKIDPASELGASAAKFKPRFEEMKKMAAAKKEKATETEKKPAPETK